MRYTSLAALTALGLLVASPMMAQTPAPATKTEPKMAPATKMAPAEKMAPAKATETKATPAAKVDLLDINTATVEQLEALKGVGKVRAEAIVKGRPYKGKDELMQKKIVPENVYKDIKDKIIAKQG